MRSFYSLTTLLTLLLVMVSPDLVAANCSSWSIQAGTDIEVHFIKNIDATPNTVTKRVIVGAIEYTNSHVPLTPSDLSGCAPIITGLPNGYSPPVDTTTSPSNPFIDLSAMTYDDLDAGEHAGTLDNTINTVSQGNNGNPCNKPNQCNTRPRPNMASGPRPKMCNRGQGQRRGKAKTKGRGQPRMRVQ